MQSVKYSLPVLAVVEPTGQAVHDWELPELDLKVPIGQGVQEEELFTNPEYPVLHLQAAVTEL